MQHSYLILSTCMVLNWNRENEKGAATPFLTPFQMKQKSVGRKCLAHTYAVPPQPQCAPSPPAPAQKKRSSLHITAEHLHRQESKGFAVSNDPAAPLLDHTALLDIIPPSQLSCNKSILETQIKLHMLTCRISSIDMGALWVLTDFMPPEPTCTVHHIYMENMV